MVCAVPLPFMEYADGSQGVASVIYSFADHELAEGIRSGALRISINSSPVMVSLSYRNFASS